MRSPWESNIESGLTSMGRDGSWEMYRQICSAKAARKAGYIANMLLEIYGALDFVSIPDERSVTDTDFWKVGIWEPVDADDTGTLFAHDDMVDLAQPLIKVIGQVQADVPLARDARYAYFFEMGPGEIIPYHRDGVSRVITDLWGSSEIRLQNQPTLEICLFELDPGDTYTMRLAPPVSGETTLHAVQNGFEPRLTMMLGE